jgi:hypothetical protein
MAYTLSGKGIIWELLHDEVIIANLDVGIYYSIRGSGTSIWQLLIAGNATSSIEALLIEKYGNASGLVTFVERLVEEGLLSSADSSSECLLHLSLPDSYESPQLERYEEMKNLLLLDPIHEVDEQGWPSHK